MRTFVADFETTTNADDCRVWAYAICEVGNKENVITGTNINDFMNWCSNSKENYKVLFHNLKFDSQFILVWLFENGFVHTQDNSDRKTQTFNTLINDKGMYYQLEVIFKRTGKNINKVVFQDSMKLVDMSVEKIAKTFNMPISKLEIDYKENREIGHDLTDKEKSYIANDVKIVATAVEYFYENNLERMTIGACALDDYKKLINQKNFERFFPIPEYDRDVRQSYRGGFTYLNPKFAGKEIKKGIVLDYNSVYPSVMYEEMLPYGTPIFFLGKYEQDDFYPLSVQMVRCSFDLKEGAIPTIQIRHGMHYQGNEYITTSNDQEITLCLTNVDLELFIQQYDVHNLEFLSGWKFKATTGLFKEYIDKWYNIKIQSKIDENWGLYEIAKRMLNSLYGKFGTLPKVVNKIPFLNKHGIVDFKTGHPEFKDAVYIPMATFITAYARSRIINAAQKVQDDYYSKKSKIEFVYADTDSLHLKSDNFELPAGIETDDLKLGYFKFESKFNRAKYLRQKCYIQNSSKPNERKYNLKITVAGMPESCYQYVNFNNFKIGASYKGKLEPTRVPGGVLLTDIDFTIKKV